MARQFLTIPCKEYGDFTILKSLLMLIMGIEDEKGYQEFLVAFQALNEADQEAFACDLYEILED